MGVGMRKVWEDQGHYQVLKIILKNNVVFFVLFKNVGVWELGMGEGGFRVKNIQQRPHKIPGQDLLTDVTCHRCTKSPIHTQAT